MANKSTPRLTKQALKDRVQEYVDNGEVYVECANKFLEPFGIELRKPRYKVTFTFTSDSYKYNDLLPDEWSEAFDQVTENRKLFDVEDIEVEFESLEE